MNETQITKKQAFEQANGNFTPVAFLASGKIHISAMSFETLADALNHNPGKWVKHAASQKDFVKYYGNKELLG